MMKAGAGDDVFESARIAEERRAGGPLSSLEARTAAALVRREAKAAPAQRFTGRCPANETP
jgi:hypothetical protein